MKKILVVFNPRSGEQNKDLVRGLVEDYLSALSYHAIWHFTTGKDDEKVIKKLIGQINPDLILACGGDGTCNLVAEALVNTTIPMAILPAGSANALARELKIPLDISEALSLISQGKPTPVDYILVNGKLCIRQAGVGVNAQLIKTYENSAGRGMFKYMIHFVRNLFRWKQFSVRVESDTRTIKKRHVISVTIASSRTYATGAVINPVGHIDDGMFEVILIRSFPFFQLPKLAYQLFKGTIHESVYSDIISCDSACITFKREKLLQIDGELAGRFQTIDVSIVKKGLRIVTP